MPNYRADLYTPGEVYERTERYVARHHTGAVDAARGLAVAERLDHAKVFVTDGAGGAKFLTRVGGGAMSAEDAVATCTDPDCTTKTALRCDTSTGVGCGRPFCGEHLYATDRDGDLCAADYATAVDLEADR